MWVHLVCWMHSRATRIHRASSQSKMQTDLLRYSGTPLYVCLSSFTPRQKHDVVRYVAAFPDRIRVCDCIRDPWIRHSLSFLTVQWTPAQEQCNSTLPISSVPS
jgi:hypothetical protein